MVNPSYLLNTLVCLAIVMAAASFTASLHKNKTRHPPGSLPALNSLILFWALVGVYFLAAGTRTFLAALASFPELETLFYHASTLPLALLPAVMVYFAVYIYTGNQNSSLLATLVSGALSLLYLASLTYFGVTGPLYTNWGATFQPEKPLTIFLAALFTLPTILIMYILATAILYRQEKPAKLVFSLLTVSLVFDFTFLEAVADRGFMQMAARIFIFLASSLGYFLYFSPPEHNIKNIEPLQESLEEGEKGVQHD